MRPLAMYGICYNSRSYPLLLLGGEEVIFLACFSFSRSVPLVSETRIHTVFGMTSQRGYRPVPRPLSTQDNIHASGVIRNLSLRVRMIIDSPIIRIFGNRIL
jgi:hypothetical protein